ncbi:hypothetical protein BKA62DRAFT_307443 [Auriculariales sp. MPI-PUGE-AT-0066]|nr:hypothetical protein BKA62DRAFT_307443 [Auriculariales sp. MPI-PUGE-AT-0066]
MYQLPTEIYQDVFSHLGGFRQRPSFTGDASHLIQDLPRVPILLGSVCKQWRDLVLQTPELWSFICAHEYQSSDEYFSIYLERSREHALDVWITQDGVTNQEEETSDFFKWLHLLQQGSHRWRRIRVDFVAEQRLDRSEFGALSKPLPLLEELILIPGHLRDNLISREADENDHRYLMHCPRLFTYVNHTAGIVPSTSLPTLQYLSLSIRGLADEVPLWATLAMTPALTELSIYFSRWRNDNTTESPPEPISLPVLRKLGIYGKPRDRDWDEYLRVPALHTLGLSIEPLDSNSRLCRDFRRQVRHLIITTMEGALSNGYFYRGDALALNHLENVETLEILDIPRNMFRGDPEEFFLSFLGRNRLARVIDSIPHWASTVTSLKIRNSELKYASCGSLAEFISSREKAAAELGGPPLNFQFVDTKVWKSAADNNQPAIISAMKHFQDSIHDSDRDEQ